MNFRYSPVVPALIGAVCLLLQACGSQPLQQVASPGDPPPGTLAYDKAVFQSLLADHTKIRRVVTLTATGVEAATESDDPDVAARIKDHTLAMQSRMKSGSRVRAWDPVFVDLFDNHQRVTIAVSLTNKGVSIRESGADQETVALLHSHALGVSEFVREGHEASARETPRLPAPTPGRTVVSLGSFRHQFDRAQPDAAAIGASKAAGATAVIDFRKASEDRGYDERTIAEQLGLAYVNIPYQGDAELTDEVFAASRKAFGSLNGPALLHCRSGNRVGAAWLPYRVLDGGLTWEAALAEAKAVGLKDARLEAKAKDYIARNQSR
ncbi:MAG TPA: sulfur transferase domain-containing protein [Phycisphaerales bacterium]|nr:sulfur transferase domain-containing protein [Phycisphaerales bacterium]